MTKGPPLSAGISKNGYHVSDNRPLNCEGVAPFHIKGGETAMWYPFKLTQCPSPTETPNCQRTFINIKFKHTLPYH